MQKKRISASLLGATTTENSGVVEAATAQIGMPTKKLRKMRTASSAVTIPTAAASGSAKGTRTRRLYGDVSEAQRRDDAPATSATPLPNDCGRSGCERTMGRLIPAEAAMAMAAVGDLLRFSVTSRVQAALFALLWTTSEEAGNRRAVAILTISLFTSSNASQHML